MEREPRFQSDTSFALSPYNYCILFFVRVFASSVCSLSYFVFLHFKYYLFPE